MNMRDFPELTAADIHRIEARAHQLRAEYMRDLISAFGRRIATLSRKTAMLFHRRRGMNSHPHSLTH